MSAENRERKDPKNPAAMTIYLVLLYAFLVPGVPSTANITPTDKVPDVSSTASITPTKKVPDVPSTAYITPTNKVPDVPSTASITPTKKVPGIHGTAYITPTNKVPDVPSTASITPNNKVPDVPSTANITPTDKVPGVPHMTSYNPTNKVPGVPGVPHMTSYNPTNKVPGVPSTASITPTKKVSDVHSIISNNQTKKDSLSNPIVRFLNISNNTMEISCFSESGSLPITYSIFKNSKNLLQRKTIHSRVPAIFNIQLIPGSSSELKCKAENEHEAKYSNSSAFAFVEPDTPKSEKKWEDESGPEHIITLNRLLTSVEPDIQRKNLIILLVCCTFIVSVLAAFLLTKHFCKRHYHKKSYTKS